MSALSISRIVFFAIVLLVLRIIASALVVSPGEGDELTLQVVLRYLMGYLLDAAVVIAVFTRLARVQARLPYIHAFAVVFLQELLSVALMLAIGLDNPQSPLWLLDWIVLMTSVLLGTELGRRLRVIAEKN